MPYDTIYKLHCSLWPKHNNTNPSLKALGIRGIYINSSIVNKGAPILLYYLKKKIIYKIEGQFIPIQKH